MSKKISNILHAPIGWLLRLIALLPFKALYVLADITYFILFHIVGYRKNVVKQNLHESFPNKSDDQINAITQGFYHWFADYIFETIKLLHISDGEMRKRFVFKDMEIVDNYFDQNQSIVAYAAHYCNWEWIPSITMWTRHDQIQQVFCQVYRPLKNEWTDEFMLNLRRRFNSVGLKKRTVLRDLLRYRRDGKNTITGFMSDQHPSHGDPGHIINWLNHPTAIISGTEVLARKLNMAVVYLKVCRVSRGHYTCTIVDITSNPNSLPQGELTEKYARLLEQQINEQPETWLWTHKRWKKKVSLPRGISPK